ncbi:MAG: alpha/beta hydrolase-fold protein [Polyangiaceae bacterium]
MTKDTMGRRVGVVLGMTSVAGLAAGCENASDAPTEHVAEGEAALCAPAIGTGDSGPFTFTDNAGFSYDYYVYVPPTYDDCNGEFPLVLAFHGAGGTAAAFSAKSHQQMLRTHADTVGAVILWVDSGTPLHQWNAGFCCNNRDHVAMVDELVAYTQSRLRIDPDRIHAVGFSNGGMFAQHLAASLPNVFASVASVAGASGMFTPVSYPPPCWDPYDLACWSHETTWGTLPPPASDVAVFMVRGSNDNIVPVNGIPALPLVLFHPAVTNPAMAGESDFELWSSATGCTTTSVQTFAGVGDHHLCQGGGRKVRHDIVFNMAHFWPTDDPADPNFANYDGPGQVAQFLWNNPK